MPFNRIRRIDPVSFDHAQSKGSKPHSISAIAVARPIPDDVPVTNATFLFSHVCSSSLIFWFPTQPCNAPGSTFSRRVFARRRRCWGSGIGRVWLSASVADLPRQCGLPTPVTLPIRCIYIYIPVELRSFLCCIVPSSGIENFENFGYSVLNGLAWSTNLRSVALFQAKSSGAEFTSVIRRAMPRLG